MRFFIDNPDVVQNDGFNLTDLLIDSVCNDLGREELRQRFTGGCFDGQYIHLNVRKHLAGALSLSLNFMDNTHDAARPLELACKDAKEGKVDRRGMCIVPKCEWLIQLDHILQQIMTHFRYGHNHISLHNIAKEKNEIFLEFNLFSETRFVEYSHRTYDHFVRMFYILY